MADTLTKGCPAAKESAQEFVDHIRTVLENQGDVIYEIDTRFHNFDNEEDTTIALLKALGSNKETGVVTITVETYNKRTEEIFNELTLSRAFGDVEVRHYGEYDAENSQYTWIAEIESFYDWDDYL